MKVTVVGAGSVGRAIAKELLQQGHEVTILEESPDAMQISAAPKANWILCDACSPAALEEAQVQDSGVLVAATGDDKVNLVVSLLAKTEFEVDKVVARVNDPENEWLFTSEWGVDVQTSTPRVMTALVEEAISTDGAVQIFRFNNAEVGVYAIAIPEDSRFIGLPSKAIEWPKGIIISAVIRGHEALPLSAVDVLLAHDELLVVAEDGYKRTIAQLESILNQTA